MRTPELGLLIVFVCFGAGSSNTNNWSLFGRRQLMLSDEQPRYQSSEMFPVKHLILHYFSSFLFIFLPPRNHGPQRNHTIGFAIKVQYL